MAKISSLLVPCLLAAACAQGPTPLPEEPARPAGLSVGVTPHSSEPMPQAEALAEFVSTVTGEPAHARTFADYDSLADALAAGEVDIAWLSPLAFVRSSGRGKVQPLLRALRGGRDTYRAVLFAREDSRLRDLDSLRRATGLKVAWVDPSSASGHLFPKALLVQAGIDPASLFGSQRFLGNHDAVCRAVLDGEVELGATFSNGADPKPGGPLDGCRGALGPDASPLRVLATTAPVPNEVLVVREGFPGDLKGRLMAGATSLPSTEEGRVMLERVFQAEGFAPVRRDDYEQVRRMLEVFRP